MIAPAADLERPPDASDGIAERLFRRSAEHQFRREAAREDIARAMGDVGPFFDPADVDLCIGPSRWRACQGRRVSMCRRRWGGRGGRWRRPHLPAIHVEPESHDNSKRFGVRTSASGRGDRGSRERSLVDVVAVGIIAEDRVADVCDAPGLTRAGDLTAAATISTCRADGK